MSRTSSGNVPRPWARISLERAPIAWYPSRLKLVFQDRQVEIGRFLNETERSALAVELNRMIRRDDGSLAPVG